MLSFIDIERTAQLVTLSGFGPINFFFVYITSLAIEAPAGFFGQAVFPVYFTRGERNARAVPESDGKNHPG